MVEVGRYLGTSTSNELDLSGDPVGTTELWRGQSRQFYIQRMSNILIANQPSVFAICKG
jgi:hypothetical protein